MHKRANVTLKTVAATAGCSIAVASTVLNGSRGNTKVSDPMRRKINASLHNARNLRAAQKLAEFEQ